MIFLKLRKIFLDLREREEIGKEFVGLFDNMSWSGEIVLDINEALKKH